VVFVGMVDTPMNLLLLPLLNHLPRFDLWSPVSFLLGHLASWDFLFSFSYFVMLGTAFWFELRLDRNSFTAFFQIRTLPNHKAISETGEILTTVNSPRTHVSPFAVRRTQLVFHRRAR
jgi:hypothetical protein